MLSNGLRYNETNKGKQVAKSLLNEVMTKPSTGYKHEKAMIEKIESGYLKDRGPKYRKKKTFSPSTLVWGNGSCARYWFYAFTGAVFSDDADAYAVANMGNGTLSHGRIQKAMADSGFLIEEEAKVINEDPPIFGFADGIVVWEGERLVIEIKTMRDEAFQYRKQDRKPPVYHLEQLLYYMKVFKMSKGLLVYEGKNSHELLILPVEINDEYIEWINQAFDWMRDVRQSWENGLKPERTYRTNSKVCKGCPVKEMCFSEGKEGDVRIEPLGHLAK
jgi:CRISPR/Cas system-associated exonuclease Cas4 (RecB family)